MKTIHLLLSLAALAAASSAYGVSLAHRAQEPRADAQGADAQASLRATVGGLVGQLFDQETELHVGATPEEVSVWTEKAASSYVEHYLPLARTPLAPQGDWKGVVYFSIADTEWGLDPETGEVMDGLEELFDPDQEPYVDVIIVTLLCEDFDKGKFGKQLVELGVELGLDIVRDEDEPAYYYDISDLGPDLGISLGQGVVVIEVALW